MTSLDVPGQVAADNRPAEYGHAQYGQAGPSTARSSTAGSSTARVDLGVRAARRSRQLARVRDVVGAYLGLTKPRIIELLLVTTVPAMFLAAGGVPPLKVVLTTMVGGCLAAASANAFNCVLDRDIDERMRRTRRRPLPRHAVGPLGATVFGLILGIAATLWLGYFVNWLSAALALGANAFYILVYTVWLKRRTPQNIIWGGIAGCFPPLIGWTAVTGSLALAPFVMFVIVFFWTPPHTWALAMRYREDYAAANVPMLPVVRSAPVVARQIMAYAVVTVLMSLLLWPLAHTGWFYPVAAVILGVALLWQSALLLLRAERGLTDAALKPMRLFHWTNSYLALLFVAAAVDTLLR